MVFLLFSAFLLVSDPLCVYVKEEAGFFQVKYAVGSIPEGLRMMASSLTPVVQFCLCYS